ncbi:hypothetical protein Taro_051263 [Colocasia esculenta]|uniref:Protein TILLER ANGLE CONTROL 1 n=1 Tax=Colocasia esculenta TaxID=4460 RepID=A0A843XGF6_COLES|nr:hypothetical protein [Colocasia esculenta]
MKVRGEAASATSRIFDWVHRKIHPNMEYRKVPRHKKDPYVGDGRGSEDRDEIKKGETEKAALLMDLHHVASIQQALDEILTIGTLGHIEYQHQEAFLDVGPHATQLEFLSLPLASKEEQPAAAEANQEEKEEEPAVEAAASAAHSNHNMVVTESFKKEMLEILGANNITGSSDQNVAGEDGDLLEPLLQETKANRKERITLADLFMASEDDHADMVEPTAASLKTAAPASAKVQPEKEAKIAFGTKVKPSSAPSRAKRGGSALTKKLTPWKKEGEDSSPPPKKLQRVIRRMLKKKIHPEMAREVNASVPSMQPAGSVSTGESASLIWCIPLTIITVSANLRPHTKYVQYYNTSQIIIYAAEKKNTNCRIYRPNAVLLIGSTEVITGEEDAQRSVSQQQQQQP